MERSGRVVWPLRFGVAGLTCVAAAAALVDVMLSLGPTLTAIVFAVVAAAFLVVGLLIVERSGGNRVGPILLLIGASVSFFVALDAYIRLEPSPPGMSMAAWIVSLYDGPFFFLIGSLFLLFPDGRLPSRRWRVLVGAMAILAILTLLNAATATGPLPYYPWIDNPLGLTGGGTILGPAVYGLLVGTVVLAALSLVVRWRRADVIERAQLKWVAAVACLVGLAMISYGFGAGPGQYSDVGDLSIGISLFLFPVAIGVAILRYRLFEIDRIVSRTISWAVVTGLLVATFVGVVVGLQTALTSVTTGNTLAVAASTLLVFGLFQPVRRRVQHAVDRRFDRSRVDAERTLDALVGRLRDDVDLEAVRREILHAAGTALRPAAAGLWLRPPERGP